MLEVFGIVLLGSFDAEIEDLIQKRQEARTIRDFVSSGPVRTTGCSIQALDTMSVVDP